jgi:hypothetical protein
MTPEQALASSENARPTTGDRRPTTTTTRGESEGRISMRVKKLFRETLKELQAQNGEVGADVLLVGQLARTVALPRRVCQMPDVAGRDKYLALARQHIAKTMKLTYKEVDWLINVYRKDHSGPSSTRIIITDECPRKALRKVAIGLIS